jgi:hypothetical protein
MSSDVVGAGVAGREVRKLEDVGGEMRRASARCVVTPERNWSGRFGGLDSAETANGCPWAPVGRPSGSIERCPETMEAHILLEAQWKLFSSEQRQSSHGAQA